MRPPIPVRKALGYIDGHIASQVGAIQILVPSSVPGLCVIKSAVAKAAHNWTQACLSKFIEMEAKEQRDRYVVLV